MPVTVSLPDEVLADQDIARKVLEEVALEGFRSSKLTIAQVRRLLGFETSMEAHEFLSTHGVPWVNYSLSDAQRERELLKKILG